VDRQKNFEKGRFQSFLCYKQYWVDTTIGNLDEQVYREFRACAARQGRNIGELLNEAMRIYMARAAASPGQSSLRALEPEPFLEGDEHLSQEIDSIVYGKRQP
jgi:hypothetical protein